jgi:hypothetical protein
MGQPPKPWAPTATRTRTPAGVVTGVVPADQNIPFDQCLFTSRIDFSQANPNNVFASAGATPRWTAVARAETSPGDERPQRSATHARDRQ